MAETADRDVTPRRKSFMFRTNVEMTGSKSCLLSSDERVPLDVSSPPEFNGEEAVWTPEHMLVGAVETCLYLTFMHYARRKNIRIISFESTAECRAEFLDGSYRITHIIIKPIIVVAMPANSNDVVNILHDAEKHCLVSNSITAIVEVNPTIASESL